MNGVHDMGGMHGMGPIEEDRNERVFHTVWQSRAFGKVLKNSGIWLASVGEVTGSITTRIPAPPFARHPGMLASMWPRNSSQVV